MEEERRDKKLLSVRTNPHNGDKTMNKWKKMKRGHFYTQEAVSTHQKGRRPRRLLHTHLPYSGLNQWSMEIKRP